MSVTSEMRVLIKAIEESGDYVVGPPTSAGHRKVLFAEKRNAVVDENGPVTLPSTPGDVRWRKANVNRLIRAGILKEDPWEESPGKKPGQKGLGSEEMQARKLEGIKARYDRNMQATDELRNLANPVIKKIGSWDQLGFPARLADVVFTYGINRGLDNWFDRSGEPSHGGVGAALRRLRRDERLNESAIHNLTIFFRDLADSGDVVTRWAELMREAKGLQPREAYEQEPQTAEEKELEKKEALEWTSRLLEDVEVPVFPPVVPDLVEEPQPVEVTHIPSLALEVLYEMVHGKEVVDRNRVLGLARQVAFLEALSHPSFAGEQALWKENS